MSSATPPLTRRLAVGGLTALTLVNLLNYLDRYVVSALVPALERAHMGLNDFRAGALMTGFLVIYMLTAPVFGIVGDRASRTRTMAIGVAIWSLATGLSGAVRNFLQLLIARGLVGVGEAAYGTISPALIADYFPLKRRGRVFAIFYMAIPVGAAFGYIVGGLVSHWFGWRAAFLVAGGPGLLLAWWILRLPDPPRGIQDGAVAIPRGRASLGVYWRLLWNKPYLITVLGYAAYTFAVGGLAFWMPTFLERVRGLSGPEATTGFGAVVVVTGFTGTFAGGWLGDFWLRYSRGAYFWISALSALIAVPLSVVALAVPTPAVYFSAIVGAEFLLFMSTGPINSAVINLITPGERASAVALSVLLIHVLGDVISPPLIGAVSDRTSLGVAVLIVPAAIAVCAVLWFVAGRAAPLGSPR